MNTQQAAAATKKRNNHFSINKQFFKYSKSPEIRKVN